MGRFDDALAHYRKSLELDPSNHNATRMIERIQREAARSPETT
jgi:cytochrome c-type biogenesis protein CcmH/NrfG